MIKQGITKVHIRLVVETRICSIKAFYSITFLFRKHAILVNRDITKTNRKKVS